MVVNLTLLCFRRLFSTWVNKARDMADYLKQVLSAVCWMQHAQRRHDCYIQEMLYVLKYILLKAVFTVRHCCLKGEDCFCCWVLSCRDTSNKKSEFKYNLHYFNHKNLNCKLIKQPVWTEKHMYIRTWMSLIFTLTFSLCMFGKCLVYLVVLFICI